MNAEKLADEFDLRPDPRILPMLGEINLKQWRCIAELVDNSVDGFLRAVRSGHELSQPTVYVTLPTSDSESTQVVVRDNGFGMTPEMLEQAVRAGWSGNNPIESLGLFGMGFNIATARLGTVTTVWTSEENALEWHGVRIDFDELQRQGHFRTPHITRPKVDPAECGTEVQIGRLKAEQRAHLARPYNRTGIKKKLATAYSSMLRESGTPIEFALEYMGRSVTGSQHCVWNEDRTVPHSRYGDVAAVQKINRKLTNRPFCINCWSWVQEFEKPCPLCGAEAEAVFDRKRRVHGWIGIQRYLDRSNFGIDLIRNGRKIEIGNKDLFSWNTDEGIEEEYPIDDPRNRGRFVGEIHIDHCRVNYSKDRFDRTDPAWEEMASIVRGDGPLRPQRARDLGIPANNSPLYTLFQVFRRSSPKPKHAGWASILVVSDNNRATEMAKRFSQGNPDYLDDAKWWELIEEEDAKLLLGDEQDTDDGTPEGFGTDTAEEDDTDTEEEEAAPPERTQLPSLTNEYHHDETGQHWDVRAWRVAESDPELPDVRTPWVLMRRATGPYDFLVNQSHEVFRSATLTPLDALLAELAAAVVDFQRRELPEGVTFASILADLRGRYATATRLDPVNLSAQAGLTLGSIASSVAEHLKEADARALFNDLPEDIQEGIRRRMAARAVLDPETAISGGRFLEYASSYALLEFLGDNPELFLDGRYWDLPYSTLDYGSAAATEEARKRIVRDRLNLLGDAVWLSENDPNDLALEERSRLLRAQLALDLLEPDVPPEDT